MTRQPLDRFRRQLVAELSLKQTTVFHVKHLRGHWCRCFT